MPDDQTSCAGWPAASVVMMARRLFFFPVGGLQAQMLQEQVGDQRQQRMSVQAQRALMRASCFNFASGGKLER